jgi:autotransporter-associated beta strand protein
MKPLRASCLPAILTIGCLLPTSPHAATFTWARGVAGTFSWNNNTTFGTTNGNNWGATPSGAFPNAAGDIAIVANAAGTNISVINLGQNITLGSIGNIGSTNGSGARTVAAGGAFSLIFDNLLGDATISKLNTTNTSAATISAPVVIAGNGNLSLSNSSSASLTLSGEITSGLSSGTQQLVNSAGNVTISGAVGNGVSGGTVSLDVLGGNLTLSGANTYTGSTSITGGTLTLAGTSGALSTGSTITNNGTLAITRTNDVVQGTDFSASGITGTGALNAAGSGLHLTLNTTNSYSGQTNIGASANNSVVRATASGALGSGIIQLDPTGNASSARLELAGAISLANTINLPGRTNSTVAIQNISGDNTLSGNIDLGIGGNNYTVDSADGLLSITGNITPPGTGDRGIFFTGAGDIQVAGDILFTTGNTLAVNKQGSGTLTLSGNNSYTGATTVSDGTLLVNGSLGNTAVSVNAGTLGGSGAIAGAVTVSATLSPGTSIESLSTGALTMSAGSSYVFEVADNSSTGADLVVVNGTLSLTDVTLDFDAATLAALASGSWLEGNKITLISYTGTGITSGFTGYDDDESYFFGSNEWLFNYNDTLAGNNFNTEATGTSFVTMTVIPEPGAALLGGLGLLPLLRRRR